MSTTCQYDSGSMTDCQPLCDKPAAHLVVYGYKHSTGEPFRWSLCKHHVRAAENRVYPDRFTTTVL